MNNKSEAEAVMLKTQINDLQIKFSDIINDLYKTPGTRLTLNTNEASLHLYTIDNYKIKSRFVNQYNRYISKYQEEHPEQFYIEHEIKYKLFKKK